MDIRSLSPEPAQRFDGNVRTNEEQHDVIEEAVNECFVVGDWDVDSSNP